MRSTAAAPINGSYCSIECKPSVDLSTSGDNTIGVPLATRTTHQQATRRSVPWPSRAVPVALVTVGPSSKRLEQRPQGVELRAETGPIPRLQALDRPIVMRKRLAGACIGRTGAASAARPAGQARQRRRFLE